MKQFRQVSSGILMTVAAGFLLFNLSAQTYNQAPSGNMEGANWAALPQSTSLSLTLEAGSGLDGTKSLKAVTSSMGTDTYYIIRCDDVFSLTNGDKITVSFWARIPCLICGCSWVQESTGNQ